MKLKYLTAFALAGALCTSLHAFSLGNALSSAASAATGSASAAVNELVSQKNSLVSDYASSLKGLASAYVTAAQALGYTNHVKKLSDIKDSISASKNDLSQLKSIPAKLKDAFDISKVSLSSLKPENIDKAKLASAITQADDVLKKDTMLAENVKSLIATAKGKLSSASGADKLALSQMLPDLSSLAGLLGGDAQTIAGMAKALSSAK